MPHKKKRILIVDDEPEMVELLRLRLEEEGYEILAAHDGKSGEDIIHREKLDLILLDMMMPGMSGFDLISRVRIKDGLVSNLPIIIITAHGHHLDDEKWKIVGDIPLVRKPFDSEELMALIKEKVGRRM